MAIHHKKPITIDLDPDLLSTSFKIQTNWHVITGAPCSGKTTLIDLLADKGYQTVPEVGRKYIEREIAKGRTLSEIRASDTAFAAVIKIIQLGIEHELQPENVVFLDRAFPDCLTFARLIGQNPNNLLADCFRYRYATIFLLDRFPVQMNGARMANDASADFLDQWLARDYGSLGYDVVRVPKLPPQERLAFLMDRLSR